MANPEISFRVWDGVMAEVKTDCLFCERAAVQQAVGSSKNTHAQIRCCAKILCMEKALKTAFINLGVPLGTDWKDDFDVLWWLTNYVEANALDWEKITPEHRTQILAAVPCRIRCWRSGVPIIIEDGRCDACGRPADKKSVWDHLKNPSV